MADGRTYEVIISGSGPAGAGLALALTARAPELAPEILVLEASRHPREKICAGGITADGVRQLKSWGAGIHVPAVPVKGVRLRYGKRVTDIPAPESDAVVVRRDAFDHSLVNAVRARGVAVREETPLQGVERTADGVRVRVPGEEINARAVVGADGVASAVRRSVGFPGGRRHARLLVVETPAADGERGGDAGRFEFDFTRVERGIQGYVWDFPCLVDGKPSVSRGIFDRAPDGVRRRDWKREFASSLEERGVSPEAFRWKGYPVRAFDPRIPTAAPRVLLVGDAAGIDPLMGEGIAQGFAYAELAADAILDARKRGDYRFNDYHRRILRSPLGRELRLTARTADYLYDPRHFPFWISLIFDNSNVRRIVGEAMAEGGGLRNHIGSIALSALGHFLLPWRR